MPDNGVCVGLRKRHCIIADQSSSSNTKFFSIYKENYNQVYKIS